MITTKRMGALSLVASTRVAAAILIATFSWSTITSADTASDALDSAGRKLAARDYRGAQEDAHRAIKLNRSARAFYVLGEALRASGSVTEADYQFKAALELADARTPTLRARILFELADVCEQQRRWSDAEIAWRAYVDYVKPRPDVGMSLATGVARLDALAKRAQLQREYEVTRKRIAAGN